MLPENNNQDRSEEKSDIRALKTQIFTLLMALIVTSGTLTTYLYGQAHMASGDLANVQKLNNMVMHNNAALDSFISKLQAYGQRHPDFRPILKKYNILSKPSVSPAAKPAPAKK